MRCVDGCDDIFSLSARRSIDLLLGRANGDGAQKEGHGTALPCPHGVQFARRFELRRHPAATNLVDGPRCGPSRLLL